MNKSLALAFNLDSLIKMLLQLILMLTDIFTVLISFTCKERNLQNYFLSGKKLSFARVPVEEIICNFYLCFWSCKGKKWIGDGFWQLVMKEQAVLICSRWNRACYFLCQCGQGGGRGKEMERRGCWAPCLAVMYRTFWLHTIAFEEAMVFTFNLKFSRKKPTFTCQLYSWREMVPLSNGKGGNVDTDFLNSLYASYQQITVKFSFWQVCTSLQFLVTSTKCKALWQISNCNSLF